MKNSNLLLLEKAVIAAIYAGDEITKIYNSSYDIYFKEDKSPITKADKLSHDIISSILAETNIPIISEENNIFNYSERCRWEYFWLVDPLDGTKEFISRNGEFTINIALIKNNEPSLGVIYSPIMGWLYFGSSDTGTNKVFVQNNKLVTETLTTIPYFNNLLKPNSVRVVVSRSHLDKQTEDFVFALKEKYSNVEIIRIGSALKLCKISEGEADIYPRFGKTMEWDIAAGHALLLYANSNLYDINTLKPIKYNKRDLLNSSFIAIRNDFPWY